ncbi:hypothetical protein C7S13_2669 [Burkholderia cepacia]|nr:hypothetical protein [Burkholderia cepacia]
MDQARSRPARRFGRVSGRPIEGKPCTAPLAAPFFIGAPCTPAARGPRIR